MKNVSLLIISLIVCLQSLAQTATCKPDKDSIYADEPLKVEYKLDVQSTADFKLINNNDFKILNGPSISRSLSMVNGKTTGYVVYSYTLAANTIGNSNIQPPGGLFTFNQTTYNVTCPSVFIRTDSMPEDYLEQEEEQINDIYSLFGDFEKPKARRFTPDIPDAYIQANVYLSARKFKVGQQFTVTCKTNASGVEITKYSAADNKTFRLVPSDINNDAKIVTTKENKTAEVTLIPLKTGKYKLTLFSIDTGLRVIRTEPVLIKVKR
jgi:hypothetical protein